MVSGDTIGGLAMTAQIHKPHARSTVVALAVIALAAASACGGEAPPSSSASVSSQKTSPAQTPAQSPAQPPEPDLSNGPSGPGPSKSEARLRRIATTTRTPLYYLGAAFHGWP